MRSSQSIPESAARFQALDDNALGGAERGQIDRPGGPDATPSEHDVGGALVVRAGERLGHDQVGVAVVVEIARGPNAVTKR